MAWQTRNEALAATGELRGRIEGLRRERLACGEILRKSQATLEADQRTIVELLTISAAAAEQREKVHPPCSCKYLCSRVLRHCRASQGSPGTVDMQWGESSN